MRVNMLVAIIGACSEMAQARVSIGHRIWIHPCSDKFDKASPIPLVDGLGRIFILAPRNCEQFCQFLLFVINNALRLLTRHQKMDLRNDYSNFGRNFLRSLYAAIRDELRYKF